MHFLHSEMMREIYVLSHWWQGASIVNTMADNDLDTARDTKVFIDEIFTLWYLLTVTCMIFCSAVSSNVRVLLY